MFFQNLVTLIVIFFLGVVIFMPTYIRLTKDKMFDEFKQLWNKEIEAEKRKLAMQEVKLEKEQNQNLAVGRKRK